MDVIKLITVASDCLINVISHESVNLFGDLKLFEFSDFRMQSSGSSSDV